MRFLFATIPVGGHINPGLAICSELVARGHEVSWLSSARFEERIRAAKGSFIESSYDFDETRLDEQFPSRAALRGVPRLKFDLKHVFVDSIAAQVKDLEAAQQRIAADVVVADTAHIGAGLFAQRAGLPWASYGITALTWPSVEVPPFGLGMMPDASYLGRVRNRALHWATDTFVFGDVMEHLNRTRRSLGFEPLAGRSFFKAALGPYLYLQGTVEAFEYPRSDLPRQVHFVGPFLPPAPEVFSPPEWWSELEAAPQVVHVTQGTVTTDADELIRPTLEALANENLLVVVALGRPLESFTGSVPRNVRLASFVSYSHLLPRVDAMVTNAGYGGVQLALAHGVPLVAAGNTEEKPEVAARVAWSGVGVNLKTGHPSPRAIRDAVRRVLNVPSYRDAALRVQREMTATHAPVKAAELLETLARTRAPVLR